MKKTISFRDWLIIASVAGFSLEGLTAEKPERIGKRKTMENFEDVPLGTIVDLSRIPKEGNALSRMVEITMGMTAKEVAKSKATEVVLYAIWLTNQLERVNKLFDKLKSAPSAMELQAGIDRLNFGIFGMVDEYARRMGITDHEEVMRTPWSIVYKCIEMDYQKAQFERRYAKLMENKIRSKK